MTTISIIGTCGSNAHLLTAATYTKMIELTKFAIEEIINIDATEAILVSGGAAWSDHLVVSLNFKIRKANFLLRGKAYRFSEVTWKNTYPTLSFIYRPHLTQSLVNT